METNDINNTNNTEDTSQEVPSTELTDNDVNEILENNGLNEEFNSNDSEDLGLLSELYDNEDSENNNEDNAETVNEESANAETPVDSAAIPPNSPTLLMDESTTRFSGAAWFNEIQNARVIIAGIGGIGSNVAFQLARMVPRNITLYDDDTVEMVNMAGQLFSTNDVGKKKVDAIANMISLYTSARQVFAVSNEFTDNSEAGDIMICGFDNMRARKVFYESWKSHVCSKPNEDMDKCLFIDGRLSIDTLQVLCIEGNDGYNMERYEKEFLFSDDLAEQTVCSRKQTTYLACMIGSLIVNLFTNFIANKLNPVIPYDLPFFTEYDSQNMLFKTEN